jgi:hypothetical protein
LATYSKISYASFAIIGSPLVPQKIQLLLFWTKSNGNQFLKLSKETLQIRREINKYGLNKISLNDYSLHEILDSDYLEVVFASRWENAKSDDDKMVYCFNTCSVNHIENLFIKKDDLPITPLT